MGKLLKDLQISELVRELDSRCLYPEDQKAELQDRLELWLYRNGHDPEKFIFSDSFEKLSIGVNDIRDHLLSVEASFKGCQETLIKEIGNLTAKMESMEKAVKEIRRNTDANPSGNMDDKSELLIAQNEEQDNISEYSLKHMIEKGEEIVLPDTKQESSKQESLERSNETGAFPTESHLETATTADEVHVLGQTTKPLTTHSKVEEIDEAISSSDLQNQPENCMTESQRNYPTSTNLRTSPVVHDGWTTECLKDHENPSFTTFPTGLQPNCDYAQDLNDADFDPDGMDWKLDILGQNILFVLLACLFLSI